MEVEFCVVTLTDQAVNIQEQAHDIPATCGCLLVADFWTSSQKTGSDLIRIKAYQFFPGLERCLHLWQMLKLNKLFHMVKNNISLRKALLGIPVLIQHILQSISPPSVFLPMCLYILIFSFQLACKLRSFYAILSELNIKEILWIQFHGLLMKHTMTINTLENCLEKRHS